MKELPNRKHPRSKSYDYSLNARYFVTICTHQKRRILSSVTVGRGLAPAETLLTDVGKIVENELLSLTVRYEYLSIEIYVIMPNHIHVIFTLNAPAGASPRPTLMDVVCVFKSLSTRAAKNGNVISDKLWQTSFYDHIIRNEDDYRNTWLYIDNNPAQWAEDEYYNEVNI